MSVCVCQRDREREWERVRSTWRQMWVTTPAWFLLCIPVHQSRQQLFMKKVKRKNSSHIRPPRSNKTQTHRASLLVNLSVSSPLRHLPCKSIIRLKTWLRDLQTMFLDQLYIPKICIDELKETCSCWREKKLRENLLLSIKMFYSKIFIPYKNIFISSNNIRMQKPFCIPPVKHRQAWMAEQTTKLSAKW